MGRALQIGELARETGLGIHAIRFYERQGLLRQSARSEGGFRLFDETSVHDLKFISQVQALGFSLTEIRELLVLRRGDGDPCSHVRDLLRAKIAVVRHKLRELTALEERLESDLRKRERKLRAAGDSHRGSCPVLDEIAERGAHENRSAVFRRMPNFRPAVERLKSVLWQEGVPAEIAEIEIADEAKAKKLRFPGSPTIRINGLDVESAARLSKDFGMMCRTYLENGKQVGLPSRESIRATIREATQAQPAHTCCQPQALPTQPDRSVEPKRKWLFGASVAAAIVASLCCILPIVTAITGIGVLAAGTRFEHLRPYFLGATGVLLAGGFLLALRDYRKACKPGSICATKPVSRWNFIILGSVAAVVVVGLAAFPYYSGSVARVVVGKSAANSTVRAASLATVTFRIPDMDCPACAVSLSVTFQKLPGVKDAKLDVSSRQAVLTYDPSSQNVASLQKVIRDAGFHITSTSGS